MNNKAKVTLSHIAIIMDGNRRWARERGLPNLKGHKKITDEVLEPLVEHASKLGIKYITFWAFSTENWRRGKLEVKGIMKIFKDSIKKFGLKMHKKGIRIRMIGDLSRFDKDIRGQVNDLIKLTQKNKRITCIFALNYGGRDEILRAIKHYVSGQQFNNVTMSQLSEKEFGSFLDTKGIPDPELIVRTGGEKRLSGFLLWQSQYSELIFPAWYMPEFTPRKLDQVVDEYKKRQRRFGK